MAESKTALAFLRECLLARAALPPLSIAAEASLQLAAAAREQGVAGLLHRRLESVGDGAPGGPWPQDVRSALARDRRATLVRGVRQLALAARVLDRLDRAGLRALPLKGAALLETLWDSEGDRAMSDVDLLVLDDWPGALALLRSDGFVEGDPADHAAVLRDPDSGYVLELHHSVTSSPGLFPIDADGLWSRSVSGPGQVARLPSPEDLLVHLSLHAAFQHGLVLSLAQWLDFRRLFERRPPDPERLRLAVAAARAERPVAAALAAARAVVDAPVPEWLRGERPAARWITALESRAPLGFVAPVEPDLARVRLALTRGRRLDLVRRTLFTRTPGLRVSFLEGLARGAARAVSLTRGFGPWAFVRARVAARLRHEGSGRAAGTAPGEPRPERILRDCLRAFPFVRLTVTGDCMSPALAPGDRVRLVSAEGRPPRVGDVVLARHPEGLRLHRLVWGPPVAPPGTRWRTQADRGALWDPALWPGDVLGTVEGVESASARGGTRNLARSLRLLARGAWSWLWLRREAAR